MKKLFGIVAGVAVSAALMTGCGGNNNTAETKENTAETAAASAENADGDLKIAIVTSPSGVDDGSFNQDNYNGILKFIESHPGATVTPVREETGDPAAVIQAVADIVADYNVIVCPGFQFSGIGTIASNGVQGVQTRLKRKDRFESK